MIDRIKSIVDRTVGKMTHLECDGAIRVLNYLLTKEGIAHQVMRGRAAIGVESITHYWIEAEGHIIDVKIRMWFGPTATQGVFKPENSKTEYRGCPIQMATSEKIYGLLMRI